MAKVPIQTNMLTNKWNLALQQGKKNIHCILIIYITTECNNISSIMVLLIAVVLTVLIEMVMIKIIHSDNHDYSTNDGSPNSNYSKITMRMIMT